MIMDVGINAAADAGMSHFDQKLHVGDIVRATDAVSITSGFTGMITAAVRAGTVGVVSHVAESPTVAFVGYYDHPLGLPMVMERTDGDAWQHVRQHCGPVRRVFPSGKLGGPEEGYTMLLTTDQKKELAASAPPRMRTVHELEASLEWPVPTIQVPSASLERSDGTVWQPVGKATALRRQSMARMHEASLPFLRRISDERRSGVRPLLGFGHGGGFLKPGGETSMAHDAPVLAYDGSGVGRSFNLLYIDEAAEYAVVGMGSASGALYSSNLSLRLLPLADIYMPFSQLVAPSLPLGRVLTGAMGNVLDELHGTRGRHEFPSPPPHFKYRRVPLQPGDDSVLASLRSLIGFGETGFDQATTAATAWQRLRAEVVEWGGTDSGVGEDGAIRLPLELFCVSVGGNDLPVYIDVSPDPAREVRGNR